MTALPIDRRTRARGLASLLGASVAGLLVGVALTAAVAAGWFEAGSDRSAVASIGEQPAVSADLTSELADLEAFNRMYRAAFERLTADSSNSSLPPESLDRLYDTVFARAGASTLTLDEINAMFDRAF